jgi:hypothetical protein
VHERHRPERRLADGRAEERDPPARADRQAVSRRELAEEIVRVLAVDVLELVVRLAHLEELRVAARRDRHRLERDHPADEELALGELARSRSHQPVL